MIPSPKSVLLAASLALASCAGAAGPDKNGKYWLYGDGIKASFIPYGAAISNLLVDDQYGITRDLVGGFDNATFYSEDTAHPHFGSVPGRYANRIKNSTFEIDGVKYHILPNENPTKQAPKGADTLHGGPDGWDWRNWTVTAHTNASITFAITDPDGKEGFPGEVVSYVTHSISGRDWIFSMVAVATTKKTPIMLSSHTYWNLDGFANNETQTIADHTLNLPYSGQRIATDNILIPTGQFLANTRGTPNDFWSKPRTLGDIGKNKALEGNCGFNCTGYDTCYLVDRSQLGSYDWRTEGPVATLSSSWSGIQLDVYSDQDAFQFYSCNSMDGSMPVKKTQGLHDKKDFPRTIPQYGCMVLEVEDYIDGINNPEWFRDKKQIFGPTDGPYVLQARYSFSVKGKK